MIPADTWLVLLAGGQGTRFWPLSRKRRPKQFLRLWGGKSLFERTLERFSGLIPSSRTLIVAPELYRDLVTACAPGIPLENLLVEPSPRNTAPAVGLAALEVSRRGGDAVLIVSPTDQLVTDLPAFETAVTTAVRRAATGGLGTLGILPDRPATAFGYLRAGRDIDPGGAMPVEQFVEKPDEVAAARYLSEGNTFWNAGIFIFRADVFLDAARRFAPEFSAGLTALKEAMGENRDPAGFGVTAAWESLPRTSIDYAVMEKCPGVWTIPLDAGWDDLGSWAATAKRLDRDASKNASSGVEATFLDSSRCSVFGDTDPGQPCAEVVLIGVDDLIVVRSGDAILVCHANRTEDVRQAVEILRRRGRDSLL